MKLPTSRSATRVFLPTEGQNVAGWELFRVLLGACFGERDAERGLLGTVPISSRGCVPVDAEAFVPSSLANCELSSRFLFMKA